MDLLDLFVKVGVKDEASSEIDALSGNIVGKLGSAAKTAAKLLAGAFAVKKVVDFGKAAYNAYSQFEQLAGGTAKIFDEIDQSKILKDANEAFLNLNMSANQYLESINQTGATFAQTMGDKKGYETAKRGMQAISDFATGTGASISLLNEKYKLITRSASGYQSIADQFAGILPQTSKDFLEQAQAAGFLESKYKKLTDVPVAEYQEAVTAMIEKGVEAQGLLGNTAAEALNTLEGSALAAKSAWENLITEFGKPDADLESRISDLMTTIFGAVDEETNKREGGLIANASEVMMRIGQGMAIAVPQALSALSEAMPQAFDAILDKLPENASSRLQGVYDVFEHIFEHISDKIDADKLSGAFGKVADAFGGFMDRFGETADFGNVNVAIDKVLDIAETAWGFIEQNILPNLPALGELLGNVANFAMELANSILSVVNALAPFLPAIIGAVAAVKGLMLFQTIIGFISTFGTTISTVVTFVSTFGGVIGTVAAALGGWPVLIAAVVGAIAGFIATNEDARRAIVDAWEKGKEIVGAAIEAISGWVDSFDMSMEEAFGNFRDSIQGIMDFIGAVCGTVGEFFEDPVEFIKRGLSDVESSFDGLSGSASKNMGSVEKSVGKGKKAVADYNGTPLKPKISTAKVTGNVPEGKAKKSAEDTQGAIDKLKGKTVGVTVNQYGLSKSGIDSIRDAIAGLKDKTVNVTTNNKTVVTREERARGGIRRHARGDIMVAHRAGEGIPLDIVGETEPEAIVPLKAPYGREFAEMMGREAGKVMGGRPNVTVYLTYDASADAKDIAMGIASELELIGLAGA